MFSFSKIGIDVEQLKNSLSNPKAGAIVTFEGIVRNHNDGRSVLALSYEAMEALAIKEGNRVIEEARARFDIYDAVCTHRVGDLRIGDMAVWVGVSSAHRGTAFDACRFIIDEIKLRLPIWKKETYTDGSSGWVNCQACSGHGTTQSAAGLAQSPAEDPAQDPAHVPIHVGEHGHSPKEVEKSKIDVSSNSDSSLLCDLNEYSLYSRQMILKEVGEAGQEKLKQASVLVIGAGGLGSTALMYLAGAGVGTITICDSDVVAPSNLHRQTLFTVDDLGKSKAHQAANRIRSQNPFVKVNVLPERFSEANAVNLFSKHNLILDCSDNFETKFLCNDTVLDSDAVLIQASIYQFEGQIHLFARNLEGGTNGQCLRCLWPQTSKTGSELACLGSCAETGVLGVVPGVFGCLQASEAIKFILGIDTGLAESTIMFDMLSCVTKRVKRRVISSCECQSSKTGSTGTSRAKTESLAESSASELELEFDACRRLDPEVVIDVREESEVSDAEELNTFWSSATIFRIPMRAIEDGSFRHDSKYKNLMELSSQAHVLFVCARGRRSVVAAKILRSNVSASSQAGFPNTFSLKGGLNSLPKPIASVMGVMRLE